MKGPKPLSFTQIVSSDLVKQNSAFDNHESVFYVFDDAIGLEAYIAIHSTTLGPAHGGTRMKIYNSKSDALHDVLLLSQAMSYKSALARLPYGGAKGVILWDGDESKKLAILKAYAENIEKLNGQFRTGTDVGLTDEDVEYMAQFSKYFLGLHQASDHEYSISVVAAKGVMLAIKSALLFQRGNNDLQGVTVGIKGIGKLGGNLSELLIQNGAHIIIADLDQSKTSKLKNEYPSKVEVVDPNEIHKVDVDIYSPCAFGNEFTDEVIHELSSKIIVGGANNQLPNIQAGDELFKQGILYAPDIVVNSGGLITASEDLETDGFHSDRINSRLNHIGVTLQEVFERSRDEHVPTNRIADHIAQQRILKARS